MCVCVTPDAAFQHRSFPIHVHAASAGGAQQNRGRGEHLNKQTVQGTGYSTLLIVGPLRVG